MSEVSPLFVGVLAAATYSGALLYGHIWRILAKSKRTPTGFGSFLAFALTAACIFGGASVNVIAAFATLSIATSIYWIDDVFGLNARIRILLSLITGAALCTCLLFGSSVAWPLAAALIFGAGLANTILTNIVNFYDGADLNLATFISLTGLMLLLFDTPNEPLANFALTCLAFILPFAVINSRPQSLYLGDAGAFAFAGLLTILLMIYASGGDIAPETAIPLALPALDTFYVLVVRIVEKHDLLTRNFLHLYQQLEQHQRRFVYLLPQVANTVLVLTGAIGLQAAGLSRFLSVVLATVFVTPAFYFGCRRLFLPRPTPAERN